MSSPSASTSSLSGIGSPPSIDTELTATLSPENKASAARIARSIAEAAAKEAATTTPAPKKRARKAAVKSEEEEDAIKPAKKRSRAKKTVVADEDDFEATALKEEEVEATPAPKKGRKKAAPTLDEDGNIVSTPRRKPQPKLDEDGNVIPRKKRAPKPEPVYVIPDIEQHLSTAFKGRLGYACLNTILRKKKPEPVFCSRTLRIKTIEEKGREYMLELGRQNAKDLAAMIQWNEDNNIRFMRLSSEMFPFASHEKYGYTLDYAKPELQVAGALARKYGHRLTTHPGQYTQLGSDNKKTVENAKRDLIYHCQMLDLMGMDKDSVMIIHGGGVYDSKEKAMNRFRVQFRTLPENVQHRLVLENDEMCYNSDDLLPVCEDLGIPHVLDYHVRFHHSSLARRELKITQHDWIYPSSSSVAEMMPRILATWNVRGGIRPKFHLSEPRPGAVSKMERRGHSDRIKRLPDELPPNIDLMLEAKDKEQAVLELHRIYGLAEVKHDSLRPPADIETLATAGRKSHKKKKSNDEEEEDLEGADEGGESPIKVKRAAQKRALAAAGLGSEAIDDGVLPNPEDSQPKAKKARKAKVEKPIEAELVEEKPEVEPRSAKKTPKRKPSAKKVIEETEESALNSSLSEMSE